MTFEWDKNKNEINIRKHNVSFEETQEAFFDKNRVILYDERHSDKENRYFCLGKVEDKILTVCFTLRNENIRIIGAGYWREGKRKYEEENRVQWCS